MDLSNYTFLKHVFNLSLHFAAQRERSPVLGTPYWCRIGNYDFVFYYVRGFEVVSVLIVKHVRIFLQHGFYNLSFCKGQMIYFTW